MTSLFKRLIMLGDVAYFSCALHSLLGGGEHYATMRI